MLRVQLGNLARRLPGDTRVEKRTYIGELYQALRHRQAVLIWVKGPP